jgi:hypothetical protein
MLGWRDQWGDYDEQPELLIDLGDLLIVRSKISTRGERSGVAASDLVGNCFYLTDGVVTRQEMYLHWSDLADARSLGDVAEPATSVRA